MAADALPAFRRAEKHFKNRGTNSLPPLRALPSELCLPVLDLSRPRGDGGEPGVQGVDPVWEAGWWGGAYDPDAAAPAGRAGRVRPAKRLKNAVKGDRPNAEMDGVRRIKLADGRAAFVVAEGCVLVPGCLDADAQQRLLVEALGSYTRPPNPLSLDTHWALPAGLWDAFVEDPERLVEPRHAALDDTERARRAADADAAKGPRALIETAPGSAMGYDEIKRRNTTWTGDAMSLKLRPKSVESLMRELRWANLGWVYQWTTKSYDFSTDTPIPFPPDLGALCRRLVADTPWDTVFSEQAATGGDAFWSAWPGDYEPDTGIVNFYQLNDTLMAHVDRSELDPARPLVSLSLGHAALFLLGSASRADPPRPVILRSGDVLIMSGRGRQAYHGVPRIMEGTLPAHLHACAGDDAALAAAKRWIATARININARQVFPPGFTRPDAPQQR